MCASNWQKDISDIAARLAESRAVEQRAVRVLLFKECHETGLISSMGRDSAITVTGTVETREGIMKSMALGTPDVVLMLADSRTPTAQFHEAVMALYAAHFADRVVLMAGNPTGYLALAIKARAAALLPLQAEHDVLVSALREVRNWSGETNTRRVADTAVARPWSEGPEVTQM